MLCQCINKIICYFWIPFNFTKVNVIRSLKSLLLFIINLNIWAHGIQVIHLTNYIKMVGKSDTINECFRMLWQYFYIHGFPKSQIPKPNQNTWIPYTVLRRKVLSFFQPKIPPLTKSIVKAYSTIDFYFQIFRLTLRKH